MKTTILYLFCTIICTNGACKITLFTNPHEKMYTFFPLVCPYLEFSVKAQHNIHVSLSPRYYLESQFYEIAFGGWGNSKDIIRKDNENNYLAQNVGRTVDQGMFATYWVRLNHTTGVIEAGKIRNTTPLMRVVDPEYVKMEYFGVSTGFGSSGEWIINTDIFSCPESDKNTAFVPQIGFRTDDD